ncbi:MAG TPA: polysaccharide lyase family protein, partial [Tepidisphaeraceae bacterium]|nr:polysaccharide lyase family protein [Tepidisphaeraceae bacterium]
TLVPYYAADGSPNFNTVMKQTGRNVQDATDDLTGSGLPGNWGSNVYTKYDYSGYTQFLQATTEYGSQYSVSALFTSKDTMNGGPTKQNLEFTNNISMIEFYSEHYGNSTYDYKPTQGANSSKLFGPYAFRFTPTNSENGAQLYSDAVNSMPALQSAYDTDTQLISNGYVTTNQRGSIQFNVTSPAGWSSNVNNNTVVLSDPNKNFQTTGAGYQYWNQLSTSGSSSISNVVPGNYRVSLYQYGQWGETRYDNVQVKGNQTAVPQNLKFTPENFGTAAPIWTLGTPDRSSHEFLNGHNTSATNGVVAGGDIRQYQGDSDFWAEEQTLGNPGKVVYYATAVGSTPATNDPNKWIANQWRTFNPGLYDAANSTTDNYSNTAPAYVRDAAHGGTGVGPGSYHGSPWEVHFTTTAAQRALGQFVVLSIGLSSVEAALTVVFNGHSETWSNTGAAATPISVNTDAMTRSGEAGIYEFLAFQFPTSDLLTATNADNVFTFSVNTTDGVMYDAMRMEITNTSAAPSSTNWHDYEFITNTGSQIDASDSLGLTTTEQFVPEPTSFALLTIAAFFLSHNHRRPKQS